MRFTLADAPYAGRTGRGVTVALLDSGVHGDHPHVGGVRGGASFLAGTDADDFFDPLLEIGFAGSIRREWAWRQKRGESTANLKAFARFAQPEQE